MGPGSPLPPCPMLSSLGALRWDMHPSTSWAPHYSRAGSDHTRTPSQRPVFFCSVVSSLGCPGNQPQSHEINSVRKQCREPTFLTCGHCTRPSKAARPCCAQAQDQHFRCLQRCPISGCLCLGNCKCSRSEGKAQGIAKDSL